MDIAFTSSPIFAVICPIPGADVKCHPIILIHFTMSHTFDINVVIDIDPDDVKVLAQANHLMQKYITTEFAILFQFYFQFSIKF